MSIEYKKIIKIKINYSKVDFNKFECELRAYGLKFKKEESDYVVFISNFSKMYFHGIVPLLEPYGGWRDIKIVSDNTGQGVVVYSLNLVGFMKIVFVYIALSTILGLSTINKYGELAIGLILLGVVFFLLVGIMELIFGIRQYSLLNNLFKRSQL